MKNLPISITNESFDLLAKQSGIIRKRETLKAEITSLIEITDEKQSAKIIDAKMFEEIPDSGTVISTINTKIQELVHSQEARKNINIQATENERKIASLKQTSSLITWLLIIVIAIALYFIFSNN